MIYLKGKHSSLKLNRNKDNGVFAPITNDSIANIDLFGCSAEMSNRSIRCYAALHSHSLAYSTSPKYAL